jgi:predicted MFS family arabinose efflux permease
MPSQTGLSTRYEYTVIALNWFILGFVFLDRLLIAFLFPWVLPALKMSLTQAGLVMSVLGITWAVAAIVFGGISDKVGRRIIIIPATLVFSLGSWLSGLVSSFATLLPIRGVMGIAEGAYFPAAVATVAEVSAPTRRATNIGIFQSAVAIVGMLIAPLYATAVATAWGWRMALYLTSIPGVILAILFWRIVQEPASTAARKQAKKARQFGAAVAEAGPSQGVSWPQVLKYRNVWLGAIVAIFVMGWSFTFLTFGMVFLTKVRQISPATAGPMMALHGLGGAIGYIGLTWLSDQVGRRTAMICGGILTAITTFGLVYWASTPSSMMLYIFLMGAFGLGMFPVINGPVAFEAVPISLAASSVGVIIFVGEVVGAAVVPALGGMLADARGLPLTMAAGAICAIIVAILSAGLIETAPKVLARRSPALASAQSGR